MAISPNDTFTSGQILTAAECNAFPFGVVAYSESTTSQAFGVTEALVLSVSFTAIANRYYKITYHEPLYQMAVGAGQQTEARFRLTNVTGTILYESQYQNTNVTQAACAFTFSRITTFTAGATTVVSTGRASVAPSAAFRGATNPGFLMVEDIGPA